MFTIHRTNVNYAWLEAIQLMQRFGVPEDSRAGRVSVMPGPVTTVYDQPRQRVLFDPVRDANPIFHLHEALWMLAGRNDATWLDQFVSDFSQRFAEPDGHQHGAYGYRWRQHFWLPEGEDYRQPIDQLDVVVDLLAADPGTRQAVIQMWDVGEDLGIPDLKDRPCNTHIYLRLRTMPADTDGAGPSGPVMGDVRELDMAVCCRSNDLVWGCYGANAVHFSILQEYLAARLGVEMGRLTQFSFNWHMYSATKHLATTEGAEAGISGGYPGTQPLVQDTKTFDAEVRAYVQDPGFAALDEFNNTFFISTAYPMYMANIERRAGNAATSAMAWADRIWAPDWRKATMAWLERKAKK